MSGRSVDLTTLSWAGIKPKTLTYESGALPTALSGPAPVLSAMGLQFTKWFVIMSQTSDIFP